MRTRSQQELYGGQGPSRSPDDLDVSFRNARLSRVKCIEIYPVFSVATEAVLVGSEPMPEDSVKVSGKNSVP